MTGLGSMRDAELVSTEVLLAKPKRFVCEILRMPDGQEIDWYCSDTPESVMVVPITAEGNVILIKQYRHNLKVDTLELPAGVTSPVRDSHGERHRRRRKCVGAGRVQLLCRYNRDRWRCRGSASRCPGERVSIVGDDVEFPRRI